MTSLLLVMLLSQEPATRYTPSEAQALFNEANEAFSRQDYATAQARYEQLINAGLGGAEVLYNLGTTHLSAGQLGPAVLYLERAQRRSSAQDIEANLAVARQRQGDQVVGAEAAEPFLQRLAAAIDPQVVGVAFLITWYLGFALAFAAWRTSRWSLGLAAAALLAVGGILGAGVGIHAYISRTVIESIVMPETVKVREFPGERARVSFEVHAGLKVRVMEETGRYVRIRLPNALEGWTEKEGLAEL